MTLNIVALDNIFHITFRIQLCVILFLADLTKTSALKRKHKKREENTHTHISRLLCIVRRFPVFLLCLHQRIERLTQGKSGKDKSFEF